MVLELLGNLASNVEGIGKRTCLVNVFTNDMDVAFKNAHKSVRFPQPSIKTICIFPFSVADSSIHPNEIDKSSIWGSKYITQVRKASVMFWGGISSEFCTGCAVLQFGSRAV
jgi:hypothetical protein